MSVSGHLDSLKLVLSNRDTTEESLATSFRLLNQWFHLSYIFWTKGAFNGVV